MALHVEQTGTASLIVSDGGETVCEIRDLRLGPARFRPGGLPLIGTEVPLPLYWMQYANHQHPERNTGCDTSVRIVEASAETITVECLGRTASGSAAGRTLLTVRTDGDPPVYLYEVRTELAVSAGRSWEVTPDPTHGEVEFCNLWPDGIFSADPARTLRYDGTYMLAADGVRRIRHHHLESSDKHNIVLRTGEGLGWFPEEENLRVTLLSDQPVTAGICAYMWDAHLGYRVCTTGVPVLLPAGTRFAAAYALSSPGMKEGVRVAASATDVPSPDADRIPAVVDGLHTFAVSCGDAMQDAAAAAVWPWETAVADGDPSKVDFSVDHSTGQDDDYSLRIDASGPVHASWLATTFGPAFRKPPFPPGARFRLEADVRTELNGGMAGIALRLHRSGAAGLFDPSTYELHRSSEDPEGRSSWRRLIVVTPPILPAPDRVHVLCELRGSGTCWFDNVQLKVEE